MCEKKERRTSPKKQPKSDVGDQTKSVVLYLLVCE